MNPWETIELSDYENHMSLESVQQLQVMNSIMKDQFDSYNVESAIILGIAGGNGVEHIRQDKYKVVYGIDINEKYLHEVEIRHGKQFPCLQCRRIDLCNETNLLPEAKLIIANLFIEYIGYKKFIEAIKIINPVYVSCAIQINQDEEQWVSDSPYLHVFDCLESIHHQMSEIGLSSAMGKAGFKIIDKKVYILPNGKALLKLDYTKLEQ